MHPDSVIQTQRLDLVPGSVPTVRAALEDRERLGTLLDARVPETWPPELLDAASLEWVLRWLKEPGNEPQWGFYFVVLRGADTRTLIGTVGYKGNPTPDGTVEIGYGIVEEYQRQGFATEAANGLIAYAFRAPAVTRVIAETLPEMEASKGVLVKCGFRFIGDGSEPGVIRFALDRAGPQRAPSASL